MFLIEPIRNFYGRFERPISSLSLVSGFVFDALTLKRVDTLWENSWIFGHLVIVAFFIVLIHVQESEKGDEADPSKKHFWYVNILQFFLGGILSTYLVFYFRSGDIFTAWPFILLLVLAFWANESLKRHYVRFSFQISLLFLSVYCFAIFLVPVVLHKIGVWVFLLSGFLSVLFISIFVMIIFRFIKDSFDESKRLISLLIGSIFMIVNILYFTNLIPPIPLSLKYGEIYHSVNKTDSGGYEFTYEDIGWRKYFSFFPDVTIVPGSPLYAFSAIFSPRGLNTDIVHEWQYFDKESRKWITKSIIDLPVLGGREDGFRTYSKKTDFIPGKWRVSINTRDGLVISRLRFNIVFSDTEPALLYGVKK